MRMYPLHTSIFPPPPGEKFLYAKQTQRGLYGWSIAGFNLAIHKIAELDTYELSAEQGLKG